MTSSIIVPNAQTPPCLSLSEVLTGQFYDWEQRGRGWQVWEQPVQLEPPFRPFCLYFPRYEQPFDDGRRHTFLSRWADKICGRHDANAASVEIPGIREPEPEFIYETVPMVEYHITLAPDQAVIKSMAEQLLLNLAYCRDSIALEIIGTGEAIVLQFACTENDSLQVEQTLNAYYPDVMLRKEGGYLARHWNECSETRFVVVDFGLANEFMRPLRTYRNFEADPLTGVVGALNSLSTGEVGVFQLLFQPVRNPWAESILHALSDGRGGGFFQDAPEIAVQAREKLAHPLYAAVLRVAARGRSPERAWDIVRGLGGALTQYKDPSSNELIPLENIGYPDFGHEGDLLLRQSHRSGMILNLDELVCLAHLPAPAVRSERLARKITHSKAAPGSLSGGEILLGYNTHNGATAPVTLETHQRSKHMYVVGASGTGKSTFLLNLLTQDIEQGRGVALLDPHGDLVDDVLARIPEHRHQDVVMFDPADDGFPIGFNILSAHSELEKNLIASDMVAVFQRLSTSWGDQMTTVFSNAILAILESERGGTLADLRRFLVEKEFRRDFLKSVRDRDVVYYWEKEFPMLSGRPQGPILTRLDAFLRPKMIRYMVAQRENRLDFADIMNTGKIFLARLAQGAIGEENAYLLGTLLVSKFHQLTLGRQEVQEAQRRPFYLYLDEFQNFVTPSMASILSGARKYRLGLVLAHQELRQLEKRDAEVAHAALSNPYARVCFRVGDADAKKLAEGLSYFKTADLLNLGTGEAICRTERADFDFNLKVPLPARIDESLAKERQGQIKTLSRQRYGTARHEIETFLDAQWDASKPIEGPRESVKQKKVDYSPPPTLACPLVVTVEAPIPDHVERTYPPKRNGKSASVMGKGGQEHKYLQHFIKRWAEGMGYRATIEKPLDNGASIDLALEKGERAIACEITVTTSPDHELDNVKKCLAAGYNVIAVVSTDGGKLSKIQKLLADALSPESLQMVHVLSPDELFRLVEEFEADAASREHAVRGYMVKVKYGVATEPEKQARKRAVSQLILGAMSKVKSRG